MLAASRLGSNVPPYHLQTTPVLALTSITADEFKKYLTALVLQAYPGQSSQQHTARQQPGRHPVFFAVKDHDIAARIDPNGLACIETLLKPSQLPSSDEDPDKTPRGPKHDVTGEHHSDRQPGRTEQAAGDRHDTS
jgi:hypothetical protein